LNQSLPPLNQNVSNPCFFWAIMEGAWSVRGGGPPPVVVSTEDRVSSLLLIAGKFGTGIPLVQLRELLPSNGPETIEALRAWLEERPSLARVDGQRAFAPAAPITPEQDRVERARTYRDNAREIWEGPLLFAHDLVRCAGISGSVAFGEPRPGDDLDLFVVTRTGSLWWFLSRAYFALFLARRRDPRVRDSPPCLNYVLEDRQVTSEFARANDLLFARKAPTVLPLHGEEYYRGLVASEPWMRSELPRLYDARCGNPRDADSRSAPWVVRAMNLVCFPLLATYLHLVGLRRNEQYRLRGSSEREFRTETTRRRLAFASRRFERLREEYSIGAPAGAAPQRRTGSPAAAPER
jgi:hypothetical protein